MNESMAKDKTTMALSPAEWEIMKIIWERGPSAARDVYAALPEGHQWAYKTVKTLLSRLVAKEALDYDQIGNSYLYRSAVAQDQMTRQEVRSVFSRIVSGTVSPVIAHLIEEADLSDKEIEQLRKTLADKRSATRKRRRRS